MGPLDRSSILQSGFFTRPQAETLLKLLDTSGTVTSVAVSVPVGFSVAGGPVTSAGTIAITYSPGFLGFLESEAVKLAGIAAGATVGANWATNLSGIPANIASWAAIAPAAKQDQSANLNDYSATPLNRMVQGVNAARIAGNENLNTRVGSGYYESTPSGSNGPGGATWHWYMNIAHSNLTDLYGWQMANPINSNEWYLREVVAAAWTSWKRIWHSGNYTPGTYPTAVITQGSNAGFFFDRRSGVGPAQWGWYADGGFARLYNGSFGDVESRNEKGVRSQQDANSSALTRQPRVFVQSADPGAKSEDGDLWFW